MAKVALDEEATAFGVDTGDVYMPAARLRSLMSVASSVALSHGAGAPPARRLSSLGSLHRHEGHSSWLTAAGHLITAIIGAGVLGLPHAVSWLGWPAGLLSLAVFFAATLWCCTLLTDCYMVKGRRHTKYRWAVLHIMGPTHAAILAVCQNLNMFLTTIGYQIAAADSMRYIAKLSCRLQGVKPDMCPLPGQWQHTLIFGSLQVLMSLLPNLESAWWASAIGALMSLGYSAIAIALGGSQASNRLGSVGGRAAAPLDKTFGIFNSLGCIGFSFSSAIVLLEVQDTLREPPAAAVSMKKSVRLGLITTFVCYLGVSVLGYMALGDNVPDNVLLGFTAAPDWINILVNAMVLVHMVSAWQVYAQPVFQTIEDAAVGCVPRLAFSSKRAEFALRLGYRTLYVGVTTIVSCLLPFFGAFTGLVGAVTYWPTAVAYPILMYSRIHHVGRARHALMWAVLVLLGVVAVLATAGSIESIVHTASSFTVFGNKDRR